MPRNDQSIRQWHLLRRLEASKGATLEELVQSVPDDYPKNSRTIRRDLDALAAGGYPLITDRANGQTRWRLMEGFQNIPALGFSATELMGLTFSRNLVADNDELVGSILGFGSQVRVVRPEALRQKVKEEAGKIARS